MGAAEALDIAANGGDATRTVLFYARGILDQPVPWLTALILGHG